MAVVIVPKWVAIINGTRCEVSHSIYKHYVAQSCGKSQDSPEFEKFLSECNAKAEAGERVPLSIPFERVGFSTIDAADRVAIAKAEYGEVCEGRR